MKVLFEDCLEFLLKTVGGIFVLATLIVLAFLAIFWPESRREPLPWLGLACSTVDAKTIQRMRLPFDGGVMVDRVFSNSPADFSNLAAGDCVVKFNNRVIFNEPQLRKLIFDMDPDEKIWMTVYRNGSYYNVMLRLAEKPIHESLPADAVAYVVAAGTTHLGLTMTSPNTVGAAPPAISADARLIHSYRGVCSNCHIIVSPSQVNQPNTQLVAALRGQSPFSLPGIPMAHGGRAITEYTWAGIAVEGAPVPKRGVVGTPMNAAGVLVDEVGRGSRGERGGIVGGDIIREINGFDVYDANSMANIVQAQRLSGGVLLIERNGQTMMATVPEI